MHISHTVMWSYCYQLYLFDFLAFSLFAIYTIAPFVHSEVH